MGRAANNCTTSVWDVAISTYDGGRHKRRAQRAIFDGFVRFQAHFRSKNTSFASGVKDFHSLVDQDMISTQPGSAQPYLSCAYVCAVVLSCLLDYAAREAS